MKVLFRLSLLATLLLAGACGSSGLSHTVDEGETKSLTGAPAKKVADAKARITRARTLVAETKKKEQASEKSLAKAESAVDKADSDVSKAQDTIDDAEETLEAALSRAGSKRDLAIERANATYEQESAAARQRHGASMSAGKRQLDRATQNQAVHEARQAYESALLVEREARREAADADLWVARAAYELAKSDALAEARGKKGPDVDDARLDFREQLAEREATLRAKQRTLAQREKARMEAKEAIDAARPKTEAADAP